MAKKKQAPKVLPPSTRSSIPIEDIEKAVAEVARARQRGELPKFEIGDTVDVYRKVTERGKRRIKVLTGTVVARSGSGEQEVLTVQPRVTGVSGDCEVPPEPEQVQVKRSNVVRRITLPFLRDGGSESTASRGKSSR
jgi:large subunit ribosomal protein L19